MFDWSDIPSLAALRAFEAAARTGSYSQAAKALNVTHAAIGHHVRALEADLGCTLVVREGRGIAITSEGRVLAEALTEGFLIIRDGIATLRAEDDSRPLAISVTPAFAINWLMPRIGEFWAAHPEIQLNISPATQVTDLRRDDIDLAIRFGNGSWPPYAAQMLTDGDFWVVARPDLLAGRTPDCVPDVVDLPWLMEAHLHERNSLIEQAGASLSDMQVTLMDTNALVLAGALEGLGVTLQPKSLVRRLVADGTLRRICTLSRDGLGYYIVTDPQRRSPRRDTLVAWLRQQRTKDRARPDG